MHQSSGMPSVVLAATSSLTCAQKAPEPVDTTQGTFDSSEAARLPLPLLGFLYLMC
jgi:hypothetical protein